ncbi:MAG: signal peptide peptidase SppA [Vampirovibrio sp.]|nr:signal peptide peptidase SppA [Vampirovibrio sp.]
MTKKLPIALFAVCILALAVGVFNAILNPADTTSTEVVEGEESGSLAASVISNFKGKHLMLVDLNGPIMMDGEEGLFDNDSSAVKARKGLEKALKDDNVLGVLLRINSPGGTVGMSQELHAAVVRVRDKKPVVVSFGDVAASGGYYTACAADKIVSNPGTLTGSIGVIISTLNFKRLMTDKLGVRSHTIKSGHFKDLLNPYREVRQDELNLVQDMIDISYDQFLNAVLEGRLKAMGIKDPAEKATWTDKITSVADGRVLVATEAQKMGLVDEIGDMHVAHKLLDKMSKERSGDVGRSKGELLPLERYTDSYTLKDFLGLSSHTPIRPPKAANPLDEAFDGMVPFSMRHPNQPLWIME